jgi:magnesium-transporting ATPase (P-type)
MSSFSKPELETQARRLTELVLTALGVAGIYAEVNENTGAIKIADYFYDLVHICEKKSRSGLRPLPQGVLEVFFRGIQFRDTSNSIRAKTFGVKGSDEALVARIVADIIARRAAILDNKKREDAKNKAYSIHEMALRALRVTYPEFSGAIERHQFEINLSFKGLTEDKARRILQALRDAGIDQG